MEPHALPSRLLTRCEAAVYLGVQPQTLASWAVTGRYGLPLVKVGRSVRYRVADLEAWLSARTVGAAGGHGERTDRLPALLAAEREEEHREIFAPEMRKE